MFLSVSFASRIFGASLQILARILAGTQVPVTDYEDFDAYLQKLGYAYVEETNNPV